MKNTLTPLSFTVMCLTACLTLKTTARAACSIDFEDRAVGTAITNQYAGVTFSVLPQTCGGSPALFMRIYQPPNGTSSGTKCLKIDTGCDFSSDYVRMVFTLPQSNISFTLGDYGTTYRIRAYSTNGSLISTLPVNIPPASGGDVGVHRSVNVGSVTKNIRTIEIEGTNSTFEAIDDLAFDSDQTPPIAEISVPQFESCDCGNSIQVTGRAFDDNGVYEHDVLDYMPVNGTMWTNIGTAYSPVTNTGHLYTWSTATIPDGRYLLRLTVYNQCGLSSEDITLVSISRTVPVPTVRSPLANTILGGRICIDGTVDNGCFFNYYTVDWAQSNSAAFFPVDGAYATYTSPVVNDPFAYWDTRTNTVGGPNPDGNYLIRVNLFDGCGHSSTNLVPVTLDNTPPTALISSPTQCSAMNGMVQVYGTADDVHLAGWVLQFSESNTHYWQTIASGNTPVVNGLLGTWNTSVLPACAYALRLIVTDLAVSGCPLGGGNQREYVMALDVVSDPLAQDTDADGMPDVWEITHGFDPKNPADAAQDADNDGKTNLEEYLAGTDPRNPTSLLRITAITREANDARVTWTTVGSHNYILEGGTNLTTGVHNSVSPLISVPPGGTATTNYLHTNGATLPANFYRVRLAP